MPKDTKLYDLLGISPSADDNEIKKGYRKMALKYHPDKATGNTEKFKEISEAYEILSNKDKKQIYDQFGLEAARHGGPMPGAGGSAPGGGAGSYGYAGGSPFGGFGGPGGFSFTSTPFSTHDAENIFEQFRSNGGMDDDFGYSSFSGGMGGSPFSSFGGRSGGRSSGMPGGFGGFERESQPEPDTVTVPLPCSLEDLYQGKLKKLNISRKDQHGNREKKTIEIKLKPGWKKGTKVTFKNEGDYTPRGRQTMQFVIEEKPHPTFVREDNDLIATIDLTFKESLLGFHKELQTIDGRRILLDRSTPINPSFKSVYPGSGMPISKSPGSRGDLIVKYNIKYPTNLTPAQRAAIAENF